MSYFASVGGLQIVGGTLMIPLVGAWTADLQLAGSGTLTGEVPVVIGNLTLQGTIFRSTVYGGQTRARIVGGAGGWRQTIDSQGYGSSSVKVSQILNDAAALVGETMSIPIDASVGTGYVRFAGIASDLLWHMVQRGFIPAWYVDVEGITQATTWPSHPVTTTFTVENQKPDEGMAIIATEDYASWMPGCTFTSPLVAGTFTNGGVHYVFGNDGRFRFEVLTDATDRMLGPIQSVIQKEVAHTRFFGRYRYTISNPSTKTIDGKPVDTTLGLPELQNVPLMSDSISTYVPPDGGIAHVEFLDGITPVCTWTEGTATVVNLLGGGNPVARLGDQTQSFLPPTLPLTGFVNVTTPFTGTITLPNPISGTVTQGSPQVNAA